MNVLQGRWPERAGERKGKGDRSSYLVTTRMAGLNRVGRENWKVEGRVVVKTGGGLHLPTVLPAGPGSSTWVVGARRCLD
jgi:hypothetical protein